MHRPEQFHPVRLSSRGLACAYNVKMGARSIFLSSRKLTFTQARRFRFASYARRVGVRITRNALCERLHHKRGNNRQWHSIKQKFPAGCYRTDIMALMYAPRNKLRAPAYSLSRDAASINYTSMRGRVCYRRLEKSSALERGHSNEFQYGRRSDRRDACLPTRRWVIGSTDIYACFMR